LKLKVRAYAKTISPEALKFTYLVTGPYSDMFFYKTKKEEIGSFDVVEKRAVLLGDGEGKIALTAMADVGRLLVAALQRPAEMQHEILIVNSFTTTPNAILAEFEKQTGENWDVSYTSLEKLKEIEKEAWETGAGYATGATLRRIWTDGGTLYERERDNGKLGEPKMKTLEEQVRQTIEAQTKT
jgi:nucleoside-diphosphate-sugar epimerase